jgi:hypothetical protein
MGREKREEEKEKGKIKWWKKSQRKSKAYWPVSTVSAGDV